MEIRDPEHLAIAITGGEYRYQLPGRGITKKIIYRPLAVELAEAMQRVSDRLAQMIEQIPTVAASINGLSEQLLDQLKKSGLSYALRIDEPSGGVGEGEKLSLSQDGFTGDSSGDAMEIRG